MHGIEICGGVVKKSKKKWVMHKDFVSPVQPCKRRDEAGRVEN